MTKAELYFRKELVQELRRIAKMMKEEKNIEKKIYYFSAGYGITNRHYRYSFSGEVLLADLVLNTAYQTINERLKMIKAGNTTVEINDHVFDKLQEGLLKLADALESKKPVQESLEYILTVAFSISGPGNYLKEKGMFEI
jgi:hypothetical protein